MLTTKCKAEQIDVPVRQRHAERAATDRPGGPGRVMRFKPAEIVQYNKNMGGVDQSDMMLYAYLDERRTLRYWKKVCFNIIGRFVVKSYIIYKQNTDEKVMNRYKFTVKLVEELAKDFIDSKHPPVDPNTKKGIEDIPDNKEKDCCICSDRKKPGGRKRSRTWCKICKKGLHHYCQPKHTCRK